MGFTAIQKTLELKECAKVPRNNLDCLPITALNYMTVESPDGTIEESADPYEAPEEHLKAQNYMTVESPDGTIEESADPYEAPEEENFVRLQARHAPHVYHIPHHVYKRQNVFRANKIYMN